MTLSALSTLHTSNDSPAGERSTHKQKDQPIFGLGCPCLVALVNHPTERQPGTTSTSQVFVAGATGRTGARIVRWVHMRMSVCYSTSLFLFFVYSREDCSNIFSWFAVSVACVCVLRSVSMTLSSVLRTQTPCHRGTAFAKVATCNSTSR